MRYLSTLILFSILACNPGKKDKAPVDTAQRRSCDSTLQFVNERIGRLRKERDSIQNLSGDVSEVLKMKDSLIRFLETTRSEVQQHCDSLANKSR